MCITKYKFVFIVDIYKEFHIKNRLSDFICFNLITVMYYLQSSHIELNDKSFICCGNVNDFAISIYITVVLQATNLYILPVIEN